MSRPTTKTELVDLGQDKYTKLTELVDSFSNQDVHFEFPSHYLNRNIRDVIAHLYHWHFLLLGWYNSGMAGNKPSMPAEEYSWKDLPKLNQAIHRQYQNHSLKDASALLNQSHHKLLAIIQKHSDQELFEKKRYSWTGSTSMGAYLISATSSHYDWAIKLIRKAYRSKGISNSN